MRGRRDLLIRAYASIARTSASCHDRPEARLWISQVNLRLSTVCSVTETTMIKP
jgi:hypothetical protein